MNDLYTFVYRGMLAEESLDKVGRQRKKQFGEADAAKLRHALSFNLLEADPMRDAQEMSVVFTALHAFENMVRQLAKKGMLEKFGETWWLKVPDKVQKKVATRMGEEAKFRWHGNRGNNEIVYCDFGDLSSIIITQWSVFESVLSDMEWTKAILGTLEKSRNIIMHGGILAKTDIERIGINIRDWIRQTG